MSRIDELQRAARLPHDEGRAHRNWEAIEARRRPARTRMRAMPFALGGLALAAAALLLLARPAPAGPLVLRDGSLRGGALMGPVVSFDDGSHVELEDARVELLENTGAQVRLWLHRGRTRFDIVPGGPRRWVIESGEVTVEVLGTAFVVEREAHRIRVEVERGSVLVRGADVPEGMRRLGAHESIEVALHPRGIHEASIDGEDVVIAAAEASTPSAPEATEDRALEADVHASDEADVRGDEATAASEPGTRTRSAADRSSAGSEPPAGDLGHDDATEPRPEDPLVTADRLRAAGRIEEALAVLSAVTDGEGPRRERALAAFTMGRVLLDRQHRYAAAATAFERAIELGLAEPLLEDARARLTEARWAAGDRAGARSAAERYLTHHPSGRWRARVEEWAAE